jgi:hypothetical protein
VCIARGNVELCLDRGSGRRRTVQVKLRAPVDVGRRRARGTEEERQEASTYSTDPEADIRVVKVNGSTHIFGSNVAACPKERDDDRVSFRTKRNRRIPRKSLADAILALSELSDRQSGWYKIYR